MGSPWLQASFVLLVAVVAAGFVVLAGQADRRYTGRAAAGLAVWLALTGGLAASGVLADFSGFPAPLFPLVGTMVVLTLALALSPAGSRMATALPLWLLVGAQSFRLPLELVMHRAATEGVMPPQMSYSGLNFDILTGASALVLGLALRQGRIPKAVVAAWNAAGFALLLNIVAIAILSTPTPFRVFMNEPANVWIAHVPYVWLPMLMVPMALLGHVLVFRRLRADCACRR